VASVRFESEAERFAYQAWKSLALTPPVDLDLVAGKLGLRIYREQFVEEIDGLYLQIPGAPPIVAVNSSPFKPAARQRFTIAHEIGHHLLSGRFVRGSKVFFIDGADTRRSLLEKACDRFAALLLMPEEMVRLWFGELSANRENRVAIMAERFGVSSAAMRVRLQELGLPYRRWK